MERVVITIGHQTASGGDEIGRIVADRLGIPLYDKKTLMRLARKKTDYEEVRTFYEEEPVNSLLFAIAMEVPQKTVDKKPFQQIREICGEGSCVLIGRCGNYIFKEDKNAVTVFIHQDIQGRIRRMVRKAGLEPEDAEYIIREKDAERENFHRYYTREEWGMAKNYELCLDSGIFGVEGTAEEILHYIKQRDARRKGEKHDIF